jgi:hypothetical protein
MRLRAMVLVWLGCLSVARLAHADAVADDIDKAAAAWRVHDSQGTLAALDAATNLLHQARADALQALLPTPPPGWTADDAETSAVSVAMLGGGTSASRTYHNGDQQVQVQITADSPMLQGMAALISGPLAHAPGMRSQTIAGHTVTYTADDNSEMALVADKVIVKVDGNKPTPEATLRSFVAVIDFDALAKLAH